MSQAAQYLAAYCDYGLCSTDERVTTAINLAIERLLPMLNPEKTIARYQFDIINNIVTMPRDVKTVLAASFSYPSCLNQALPNPPPSYSQRIPAEPPGCCSPGCTSILTVKSRWYEMLPGGPTGFVPCAQNILMDLGTGFSTFDDPSQSVPLTLRLYADIPQQASEGFITIAGLDINGNYPYSIDNNQYIPGQILQIPWMDPANPGQVNYTDTPQQFQWIGSITKPPTVGRLRLYGVDSTGAQRPLAIWEPDELNPDYRRYLVSWAGYPSQQPQSILTVLAKRRFVRTTNPYSDLMIQNLGALSQGLMALRYEKAGAFDQSATCWKEAAAILDRDSRDLDGEYSASVQLQEWWTGGDIMNLR